jgi:hypothetical protein
MTADDPRDAVLSVMLILLTIGLTFRTYCRSPGDVFPKGQYLSSMLRAHEPRALCCGMPPELS